MFCNLQFSFDFLELKILSNLAPFQFKYLTLKNTHFENNCRGLLSAYLKHENINYHVKLHLMGPNKLKWINDLQ